MWSLALTGLEENICRDCNSRMDHKSTNGENWITTEYAKYPWKDKEMRQKSYKNVHTISLKTMVTEY